MKSNSSEIFPWNIVGGWNPLSLLSSLFKPQLDPVTYDPNQKTSIKVFSISYLLYRELPLKFCGGHSTPRTTHTATAHAVHFSVCSDKVLSSKTHVVHSDARGLATSSSSLQTIYTHVVHSDTRGQAQAEKVNALRAVHSDVRAAKSPLGLFFFIFLSKSKRSFSKPSNCFVWSLWAFRAASTSFFRKYALWHGGHVAKFSGGRFPLAVSPTNFGAHFGKWNNCKRRSGLLWYCSFCGQCNPSWPIKSYTNPKSSPASARARLSTPRHPRYCKAWNMSCLA